MRTEIKAVSSSAPADQWQGARSAGTEDGMATRDACGRMALVVVLGVIAAAGQGCSYLRDRGDDAAQMFDFGLTFSKKPQFSAYMNCPVIAPLGYGKVDGYFVGMGGGKVGAMKHHQESSGLLVWGREEVSWDSFDPEQADTLSVQGVGLLGLAESQEGEKTYTPACIHYLHLGWIGIAANVRWLEIPDFFLGLFLLDPMGDDGENGGWWFW
jgi:hypothetical protein